jgi:hypothetical protein
MERGVLIIRRETLMEATLRLLRESPLSIPEIHAGMKEQGSEVTFYWLRKFSSGNVKHPSVNRVEELYVFLCGDHQ